jgi:hypothetical protein
MFLQIDYNNNNKHNNNKEYHKLLKTKFKRELDNLIKLNYMKSFLVSNNMNHLL